MTDTGDKTILVKEATAINLLRQIALEAKEALLEALKELQNGARMCDCPGDCIGRPKTPITTFPIF